MKTVAGIDLGTQSMKVVIYDYEKKEIIEKASCPMDLISEGLMVHASRRLNGLMKVLRFALEN